MAIVITSIRTVPDDNDNTTGLIVDDNGGQVIKIEGVFAVGIYTAKLMTLDEVTSYPCYGGKSGSGTSRETKVANVIEGFILPPVPLGASYKLRLSSGGVDGDSPFNASVIPRDMKSRLFALRQLMPPLLNVGPRSIDRVDMLG